MARVKKGLSAHKHRRHLLKHAKGFRWGRKSKYKLAKDALRHAWTFSYRDRKVKKRDFRQLWQVHINAACRELGINYSQFIHGMKVKNIQIDRKILSQLTSSRPEVFQKIVAAVTESSGEPREEVKSK